MAPPVVCRARMLLKQAEKMDTSEGSRDEPGDLKETGAASKTAGLASGPEIDRAVDLQGSVSVWIRRSRG